MVGEFYRCVNDPISYVVIQPGPLDLYSKEKIWKELREYGVYLEAEVLELSDEEFLKVLDKVTDISIRQELLGKFVPPGDIVFQPEWLNRSYESDIQIVEEGHPDFKYYMGADFGKMSHRDQHVPANKRMNHDLVVLGGQRHRQLPRDPGRNVRCDHGVGRQDNL